MSHGLHLGISEPTDLGHSSQQDQEEGTNDETPAYFPGTADPGPPLLAQGLPHPDPRLFPRRQGLPLEQERGMNRAKLNGWGLMGANMRPEMRPDETR